MKKFLFVISLFLVSCTFLENPLPSVVTLTIYQDNEVLESGICNFYEVRNGEKILIDKLSVNDMIAQVTLKEFRLKAGKNYLWEVYGYSTIKRGETFGSRKITNYTGEKLNLKIYME